jgi:chromosome segregation ATPase
MIQELIRDLKDIHERLSQVKLDVTRLEYDCNIKSEEILTQNRSIERLVKENSFLRERGEFMSKELDCALSEMKTREKDHLSIKEEYLSQIACLKDKVSAISEERKKLEESLCDEIKILEERNQRLHRQVKERQNELLVLSKDMDAMAREKYSLQEKMAQQEEEIRRYGIKNEVLSVRMREIVVQQTEAEAIIEELKSEIQVLTDEKLGVEEEATSTVESRTKPIKEPLEDKLSEETQLPGKSSAVEKSYSSVLQKTEDDLAENRFLMESVPLESHLRKEKNALVWARAYQVVQGIKGEAKRKDVSIEDAEQN